MNRPSYSWYIGDWRRLPGVRLLTLEERGFVRELLDVVHYGVPYGYLTDDSGRPLSPKEAARTLGIDRRTYERLLRKVMATGVAKSDENGTVYVPFFVRQEVTRAKRARGGPKSLENPNVPRPKDSELERQDSDHESVEGYPQRTSLKVIHDSAIADANAVAVAVAGALNSGTAGELPPSAHAFLARFYGDSAEARRADVTRTLVALARGDTVPGPSGHEVSARSMLHLEQALRKVMRRKMRNPDCAIVVLFKVLQDPELDGEGRTSSERESALSRREQQLQMLYDQEAVTKLDEVASEHRDWYERVLGESRALCGEADSVAPVVRRRMVQQMAADLGYPTFEQWKAAKVRGSAA